VATSSLNHQSKWLLGLPPLIVEDPPRSSEPDSPSLRNQSLKSHTEFVWTTDDSSLLEDFFTKGFLPPFNPLLTNLLDPPLVPVALVLPVSLVRTFPSIPLTTNESWNFVDTFGPPPLPQSTVTTTLLFVNPFIPFVPDTNPHMTPCTSGTQPMSGSTPLVSNSIPSTSATYSAPYNAQYSMVSAGPLNQKYGWHPL